MAYLTIGAFNHYITISASTGRHDDDDRDDDADYALLTGTELADDDYDRPSMGFCMPL